MSVVNKKICVIGLGYIGLPLAICSAYKGLNITGVDIRSRHINKIKNKKIKINDTYASKIFDKTKFKISKKIPPSDIFVICVPTPIDDRNLPDISLMIDVIKKINLVSKKKNLVIIESTIYPGMSKDIIYPLLKKKNKDILLAHCPERLNPGDKKWAINNTPRVLGGLNSKSFRLAFDFYSKIIGTKNITKASSLQTAEATKILENIFRDVNIALVNEMAQAFYRMKIDTKEVIRAASTKPFAFMPHWPGIGVGGHCIAVDPYYMIEKGRIAGFDHEFLKIARKINSNMHIYTVNILQNTLNSLGKSLKKTKIGLYGLAYKPNIDDTRESPSLDLLKKLTQEKDANVKVYDPFLKNKSNFKDLNKFIKWPEVLLVCTAHDEILKINFKKYKNLKIIIDGRNCLNKDEIKKSKIVYRGIGVA